MSEKLKGFLTVDPHARDRLLKHATSVVERVVFPDPSKLTHSEQKVRQGFAQQIGREYLTDKIPGVIPYDPILHGIVEGFTRIYIPEQRVYGREHLEEADKMVQEGNKLLFIANHRSHYDGFAIDQLLRRSGFSTMAEKAIYIQGLRLDKFEVTKKLMRVVSRIQVWPSTIPVHTKEEDARRKQVNKTAENALEEAQKRGYHIVVFPEGERTKNNGVLKPKTPLGKLLREDTVVVPITVLNTEQVIGLHHWWPTPAIPDIAVSTPIPAGELLKRYSDFSPKGRELKIVHDVMTRIAARLPEEKQGYYRDKIKR